VCLIRASPLHPYGVMNYVFGLSSVTLWDYATGSFLAMLPGTAVEVYFGSALKNLADIVGGHATESPVQRAFFWFGVVFTLCMTTYITFWLRRELSKELQRYEHYEPPSEQRAEIPTDTSSSNTIEMSSLHSTSISVQPSDDNPPTTSASLSTPSSSSKKYIFNTANSDLHEVEVDSTSKRKLILNKKVSINNSPGNQGNIIVNSPLENLVSIDRTIKNTPAKPVTPK